MSAFKFDQLYKCLRDKNNKENKMSIRIDFIIFAKHVQSQKNKALIHLLFRSVHEEDLAQEPFILSAGYFFSIMVIVYFKYLLRGYVSKSY